MMVGASGMAPMPIKLNGNRPAGETEEETRERIEKRFQKLGDRLLNRTQGGGGFDPNPVGAILSDRAKRPLASQFVGQAFATAVCFIKENKDAVERIANAVIEKQEIYGDDLIRLLDAQNLKKPEIDWTKEESWPQI